MIRERRLNSLINFDPLFDFMHFNKLRLKDLQNDLDLSPRTTAKFRKGESVSLTTVERICVHYKIPIEQVVEISRDSND